MGGNPVGPPRALRGGAGGGAVLLRADESIQECDVCGRPKPHSHS